MGELLIGYATKPGSKVAPNEKIYFGKGTRRHDDGQRRRVRPFAPDRSFAGRAVSSQWLDERTSSKSRHALLL